MEDIGEDIDRELMQRYRDGDNDALGALFTRHYEPIRRKLVYLSTPHADGQAEQAFVQLMRKADRHDADRPFWPWFHRMARNAALDRLRASKPMLTLEHDPPHDNDPAVIVEQKEQRAGVRAAVEKLTSRQQGVVVLVYFQGMKLREVGAALGIPIGTVKSRLAAALRQLRQRLATPAGPTPGGGRGDGTLSDATVFARNSKNARCIRLRIQGGAVILDLTEEEADKLLALFDPIGEMAETDEEKLAELMKDLGLRSDALREMTAERAGIFNPDAADMPELRDGDREPIQQMTFSVCDEQAAVNQNPSRNSRFARSTWTTSRKKNGNESPNY